MPTSTRADRPPAETEEFSSLAPPALSPRPPGRGVAARVARLFDLIEHAWDAPATRRFTGSFLAAMFVLALAGVEAVRLGLVPRRFAAFLPANHLGAVDLAFGLLLLFEVAGLIMALAKSVADSVGKQFELLALILMREAFVEFTAVNDPAAWPQIATPVMHILAEMAGAVAVFALLVPYYRVQRHRAITEDSRERASFITAKKVVAVGLLVVFLLMGADSLRRIEDGGVRAFFSRFYTVLVLSDVLIVLLSLRFSSVFRVVFRNAWFAAATAMARLALSAPPYFNAALAVLAMVFVFALSLAYNAWATAGTEERPAVA